MVWIDTENAVVQGIELFKWQCSRTTRWSVLENDLQLLNGLTELLSDEPNGGRCIRKLAVSSLNQGIELSLRRPRSWKFHLAVLGIGTNLLEMVVVVSYDVVGGLERLVEDDTFME